MKQSEDKIIYLAGLVDADGCFRISKRLIKDYSPKYDCRLRVTNTDKVLIDWLKKNFGGSISTMRQNAVIVLDY